jgi:hypothetical protein
MRAIFMISLKPAPIFKEPSKWSPEMNDFLSCCLKRDPNVRASAKQLLTHLWIREELLAIKRSFSGQQSKEIDITSFDDGDDSFFRNDSDSLEPSKRWARPHMSIRKKRGGLRVVRNLIDAHWQKWMEASANRIQVSEENIGEEMGWEDENNDSNLDAVDVEQLATADGSQSIRTRDRQKQQTSVVEQQQTISNLSKSSRGIVLAPGNNFDSTVGSQADGTEDCKLEIGTTKKSSQNLQSDREQTQSDMAANVGSSLLAGEIDADGALTWKVITSRGQQSGKMSPRAESNDADDASSQCSNSPLAQRGWLDAFETLYTLTFGFVGRSRDTTQNETWRSVSTSPSPPKARGPLLGTNSDIDLKLAGIGAEIGQAPIWSQKPFESRKGGESAQENSNLPPSGRPGVATVRGHVNVTSVRDIYDLRLYPLAPAVLKESANHQQSLQSKQELVDNDDGSVSGEDENYNGSFRIVRNKSGALKDASEVSKERNLRNALQHVRDADSPGLRKGQQPPGGATSKVSFTNDPTERQVHSSRKSSSLRNDSYTSDSKGLEHHDSWGDEKATEYIADNDDDDDNENSADFSSFRVVPSATKISSGGDAQIQKEKNLAMALRHMNSTDDKGAGVDYSPQPRSGNLDEKTTSAHKLGSKGELFDVGSMNKADEQFIASMMQSVKLPHVGDPDNADNDGELDMGSLVITSPNSNVNKSAAAAANANIQAAIRHLSANSTPPRYPQSKNDSIKTGSSGSSQSTPNMQSSRHHTPYAQITDQYSGSPNISSSPYYDDNLLGEDLLSDVTAGDTFIYKRRISSGVDDEVDSVDDIDNFFQMFTQDASTESLLASTATISADTLSSINAAESEGESFSRYGSVVDLLKSHADVLQQTQSMRDLHGLGQSTGGQSSGKAFSTHGKYDYNMDTLTNPPSRHTEERDMRNNGGEKISSKQVSFHSSGENKLDAEFRSSVTETAARRAMDRKVKRQTSLLKGSSPSANVDVTSPGIGRSSSNVSSNNNDVDEEDDAVSDQCRYSLTNPISASTHNDRTPTSRSSLDDYDEDEDDDDYGDGWWPLEQELFEGAGGTAVGGKDVEAIDDKGLEILFRRSLRIQSTGINLNAQLDAMRELELAKCSACSTPLASDRDKKDVKNGQDTAAAKTAHRKRSGNGGPEKGEGAISRKESTSSGTAAVTKGAKTGTAASGQKSRQTRK